MPIAVHTAFTTRHLMKADLGGLIVLVGVYSGETRCQTAIFRLLARGAV